MTPDLFAAVDTHSVPIEPLLRRLLERVDADDDFREQLDLGGFQPWPSTADEIDCRNPWFFVIAMNGGGSAYGLYLHPNARGADGILPWVYWEHEDDTLHYVAPDTARFLRGFVATLASYGEEAETIELVREVFAELGVSFEEPAVELDFEATAPWLPPIEDDVRPLAHYLELTSGSPDEAERGLLAHAMGMGDRDAEDALAALWATQGRTPPKTHSS